MDLQTEPRHRGNNQFLTLGSWGRRLADDQRNVLALNVLLLGDRQSGRSSVGNALIGGEEFPTGASISGASTTTACQLLRRNFQSYFRRQGAESDLMLRVVDTPPSWSRPQSVHELCPEGVHVIVLVVRADLPHDSTHLEEQLETLFSPEWRRHALLVLTHADHLEKAGLQPSAYLTQTSDWLRALAEAVEGGVFFLDNSCDWPSVRGRPLRDQLLHLSARNHHRAMAVRTEVNSDSTLEKN
ncbi:GTPase IMAP family member GIMD1-like [Centropristis striata]|uniref:GTPase IMAP family member GIMD1-like n=1 Tax=Centropristis striata TaxID=184440 RepID=UPI0027E0194B|nr:GTPase IMAP family member GIMD1-like [Centropristis striata]